MLLADSRDSARFLDFKTGASAVLTNILWGFGPFTFNPSLEKGSCPYRTSAVLGRVGVSQEWTILNLRGRGPPRPKVRGQMSN